jgi:endoglucanase
LRGCAVVIEALRRLANDGRPNMLFVAATTQEEIGLRCAKTAAAAIHPDIGLVIEGGTAGDQPGDRSDETNRRLSGGPDVFLYDASAQPNLKLASPQGLCAKPRNEAQKANAPSPAWRLVDPPVRRLIFREL